ncbi:MAG: 16S rRNA (guanine(966)-N(2))-methyltransferase RsmD [Burkholderiales bacterium]|nr:16S rRNA (guanine(966)-N(2))-methyltransferase RsmD [Burkholderiales bacterium]
MGAPDGRTRRRRDPADQHGPRRHQERLRPRAHARGGRRGAGAGDRLGRRRRARTLERRHPPGRRRRGAGGEHLPLRRIHGRPGQGPAGPRRHRGAALKPTPKRALKHEVRLIGGLYKRSKLPVADRPGLRPTPDRVRETLFNWLGADLEGWRVLDAFAGSGALGFEAASRGASEVLLLEQDAVLVASLLRSQQRLDATALRVERADAMGWMARCASRRYELVLIDPPFDTGLAVAAATVAARLVAASGYLYVEAPAPIEPPAGMAPYRSLRAGAVSAQLFVAPN